MVDNSSFIQDRIGRSQVRVISELKLEATDAEFATYFKECKGDVQFAIDSFLAEFGKEVMEKKPKGKPSKSAPASAPATEDEE